MTRLYDWQVEALAQPGVLAGGSLVYSAPTSAGKSLVADVLLLRSLLRSPRRGVLVVLPYNALCDEKAASLERLAKPLGVHVHRHYSDRNGPLPSGELGIIVCTFEKANAIVARLIETDRLCAVGCVVVDELHMLSGACAQSTSLRDVPPSTHQPLRRRREPWVDAGVAVLHAAVLLHHRSWHFRRGPAPFPRAALAAAAAALGCAARASVQARSAVTGGVLRGALTP